MIQSSILRIYRKSTLCASAVLQNIPLISAKVDY
jgi:hypothetical protein